MDGTDSLARFLSNVPLVDGVYQLSPPRAFQHAEEQYDERRPPENCTLEFLRRQGGHMLSFFRDQGYQPGQPVLEIGCGPGWVSAALATQREFGHLLCTDPSPAFTRIARGRISQDLAQVSRVDYGMLLAEEVDVLPPGSVALIVLRSVLHHIAGVPDFLRRCAAVLPPGGLLICEEPFYDGYVLMGFLAQCIPDALAGAGCPCTPEERALVDTLVATMQFYARRDVDKSQAEDKHLFRPDELLLQGREVGLDLTCFPNWYFTVDPETNRKNRARHFQRFFANYIDRCMHWPPEFCARVIAVTGRYFDYFVPLETETAPGPYFFGTFVFTRRR